MAKVLGEGGGDPKTASRAVAELMTGKPGLGESEFATRMIADIAADQDVIKIVEECQKDGWSNTAYEKVMSSLCGKIADRLIENRTGLTAEDGAALTDGEKAFKNIGDMIKVVDSGSKLLACIVEGDSDAAATELFNFATDNTGAAGKAQKYTLQGMQNALGVWRDGEVESAFEVYTKGSSGSLFGYGLIEPLDIDAVWDGMKGASRQLCIERIAVENDARKLIDMPALTSKEEEFYRDKVKAELKTEFERRVTLQGKIDQEKKNLDLIFSQLESDDILDSSKVWYRGFGGAEETLLSRMERMERLVQRICNDLQIDTVYADAPLTRELNGRISAYSMSEMIRAYFSAKNMAEAEEVLQQYYKDNFDLGPGIEGSWTGCLELINFSYPEGLNVKTPASMSIELTIWEGGTCTVAVDGYSFQSDVHYEYGVISLTYSETNQELGITGTWSFSGTIDEDENGLFISGEFRAEVTQWMMSSDYSWHMRKVN